MVVRFDRHGEAVGSAVAGLRGVGDDGRAAAVGQAGRGPTVRGLFGDKGCGWENLQVGVEDGEGAGLPGAVDRHVGVHGGLA